MDGEDRNKDRNHSIIPIKGTKAPNIVKRGVSMEMIKSLYIASGMTVEEISKEVYQPVSKIQEIVEEHSLVELRKAYIVEGISKIQNTQLQQSHKLMNIENNFKKLRIIQLESELENYIAYYSRWGDFVKRHPVTGDILKNSDGIPMQLRLPNVSKELSQLKESVTLSEGVRGLLHRLDEIINSGRPEEPIDDDIIDVESIDLSVFLKSGDD